MPQIGPLEIAVVLLIALLVFGPNRLPELARQVGGAMRELRKMQHSIRADLHGMMADESDGAAPPPTLPPLVGEAGAEGSVNGIDAGPAGLPPGDVPTSGSGEESPAFSPPPPPPDSD
jgi:TatA/E family protein of Tat protein translocase